MLAMQGRTLALMVCLCPCVCAAQSAPAASAPQGVPAAQVVPPNGPQPTANASLSGTITDQEGGLLPGALVEITAGGRTVTQAADSQGAFHVYGLPVGDYVVRAVDSGFETETVRGELIVGEQKKLEPLALPATVATSVSVVATQHDIAVAQVDAAEKQRVLGIVPNFWVVYYRNPAPLTAKQKFHMAWRSQIDPMSFVGTGIGAGIEQATDSFQGYGQGAAGYGRRYGASFGDGTISTFLGGAILPSLFHQDPRYYYQGEGSKMSRVRHAIASVVVTHGDNGKLQFNYSNILGNFASAGISNAYYPASDRHGAGLTLSNAAIGTAFGAFAGIMQEFVVPRLTPHLPKRPAAVPVADSY